MMMRQQRHFAADRRWSIFQGHDSRVPCRVTFGGLVRACSTRLGLLKRVIVDALCYVAGDRPATVAMRLSKRLDLSTQAG